MNDNISSTLAELTAIDKCVDLCIHQKYEKVSLFTDSRAACLALKNPGPENFTIANIISKIEESNVITVFNIIWTPGHIGIDINEIADKEANDARISGVEINISITPTEAINKIQNIIQNE